MRAFAFLPEVAAAGFLRLLSVRLRLGGFGNGVGEQAEDGVLADGDLAVVEDEDGDRVGAGRPSECVALLLLDRYLADQVVDAELRQALSDPS